MSARWLSSTCRVCLASDREMYRLANTALEETYERVTRDTLVVEGRPCCVCGVCLSALHRCRRFIDSAREANDALDRWIRNQPDTHTSKLTERPLFSFSQTPTEVFEVTHQGSLESGVKQESDTTENEDNKTIHQQNEDASDDKSNILNEEIKCEVASDDDNDYTHVSDEETDKTEISDKITNGSDMISNSEHVDVKGEVIDVELKHKTQDEVHVSDVLANFKTAPSVSNVPRKRPSSSVQDMLQKLRSGKRIKLNADTIIRPALNKRRPITSQHRRGNTDPPAALHNEGDTQKRPSRSLVVRNTPSKENKADKYSCLFCDYKTTKEYLLNAHSKIHSGQKSFSCKECDQKFESQTHLKRHLMSHTVKRKLFFMRQM